MLANGTFSSNTIILGNGANDVVGGINSASSMNKITVGSGSGDLIALCAGAGGDQITTGTGAGDQVFVGAHSNPDTFAFALGTNGINFTTVSGAAAGDHLAVNGGQLGNTLSALSGATNDTSLASYINSLGTLTKGDTYVGFNASANDTFVVTNSQTGQTGAIELTGVAFQHSTLANHVLTLA